MDLSDSEEEEEFSKQRNTGKAGQPAQGDAFGTKKPEAKKGAIANLLGSDDSDDEDFKVGKKPVGQQDPA